MKRRDFLKQAGTAAFDAVDVVPEERELMKL